MSGDLYVRDKTKEEILADLYGTARVGSTVHEQQKMAIVVRCTQDLEASLGALTQAFAAAVKSNDRLSKTLLVLNWLFGVWTVVGTIAGVYGLIWTLRHAS